MKRFLVLIVLFAVELFSQQQSIWDHVPDEIKERNSFKRYEWFYRQRAFPYDTLSMYTFLKEREKEINKEGSGPNVLQWTNIGPSGIIGDVDHPQWGEVSGRVKGIAVDPSDPNIVYIGAASGGIWKTTNGGDDWADIGDNLASLTFGSIAIDPNNPGTIYAGAGEIRYGFSPIIYDGEGLYKSTDAGVNWVHHTLGLGEFTNFGDLEVSPHDSNILFAALGSGNFFSWNHDNEGIWKSTNAGVSWTRVIDAADAFDVIIHPSDPNIVYAATGGGFTTAGFYISTDGGASFYTSNTGLPPTSEIKRIQISLAHSSPSTIYSIIYDNTYGTRAYKSTNGGSSWSPISAGVQLGGFNGNYWYDQGSYDLTVAVNPSNANEVYIGNVELHKTTDGSLFSPVRLPPGVDANNSPMHTDYQKIVFAPSNSNIIYVGSDGGIFKSIDGGQIWGSINNGITTLQFYRIASHPSDPNILFGGAQDNGVFRTTDGGALPWIYVTSGDGMECFYDYANPNTLYGSLQNGFLGKSTDGGNNVFPIYDATGAWLTPFIQHPFNSQWLYTANNNVIRSTNGGSTFEVIDSNVTTSDKINTMAISRVNPNIMILAGSGFITMNPQVKVSTDGGFSWTDVTSHIPGEYRYISRVVTHPNLSNVLYVVRSGFSAGNKIYMTTDLGSNWVNVSGNLPDVPVNDLFIDPEIDSNYYAATDLGVYLSTDGGGTWEREGMGMPFVPVLDFDYVKIDDNDRYLRAATHGRSAFQTLLIAVPVELTSFAVRSIGNNIVLNWITATETNNRGFEVQRSTNNSDFAAIGFVEGNGTTAEEHHYTFMDKDVSGILRYRLKQIDFDGSYEYSDIVHVEVLGNVDYELAQNYPNPFNPVTNISYTLPAESRVKLAIYNPLGELVETIVNEKQNAGKYEAVWNAGNHSSGVYIYSLDAVSLNGSEHKKISKKMILMK